MAELSEALDLVAIRERPWHLQTATAISGDGLDDGFGWYISPYSAYASNNDDIGWLKPLGTDRKRVNKSENQNCLGRVMLQSSPGRPLKV